MRRGGLVWIDLAVKLATVGLLVLAVLRPDLPQFQGKAFAGRAIVYPLALLAVPAIWWLTLRRRMAFPVVVDILIGLPFLIDLAGNALDLYDSVEWWDDANHLVNWAIHTAAIGILLRMTALPAAARAGLAVGWAATTAILWELGEYVAFVPNSPEAVTAYGDTLGDLALGLLGGSMAAVVTAWWPGRQARPKEGG
jgi:hypothetical protein